MKMAAEWQAKFSEIYGGPSRVYRAPGRVNLIGEHTDYNDGFVMPAAIEFYIWVAIAPRADRIVRMYSSSYSESVDFDLDEKAPRARHHWSDYVRGVAVTLEQAGHRLGGADLLVGGDVPVGSGLSSSAAIEVASAYALLANSGLSVSPIEIARLCQRAENEFVGTRCGIMDQFISCCGQAGRALLLDCRSLTYRLLPIPPHISLVICNTMVKHELATGEYNTRRAECEEGVQLLSPFLPGILALRDVSMADLDKYGHKLPHVIYQRCHHVISENARVLETADALERGDLAACGRSMAESHRSLRDDYQVSCAELDLMVKLAEKQEGLYGARMTGGGFGGCTINLVQSEAVTEFQRAVASEYERQTGIHPQIFISCAAEGAGEVKA